MAADLPFKIGQVVTNQDIISTFKCANSGGMRRSKTTNTLVIVTDHTKGLYDNKWIGNTLHYTGMGKRGNQLLNTQNKTLAESNSNGIVVHLFEVFVSRQYIYRGIVVLTDGPYQDRQKDEEGNMRNVWMFPLKLLHEQQYLSQQDIEHLQYQRIKRTKKLSDEEIADLAMENGSTNVSRREVKSVVYLRDAYVSEYAKRRADGICMLCEKEAPFLTKTGEPYLETHHIEWLANGGADSIENTVSLCPNCHRKMHVLDLPEDRLKLLAKIDSV